MFKNLFDFSKSPVLNLFRPKIVYKDRTDVYNIPKLDKDVRIIDTTKVLIMNWDERGKDFSGEAKRHQVYSKLIKIFPEVDRKRLALIIELVISNCV